MTYVLENSPAAREHEKQVILRRGRHYLTSCPPGTRAMCSFARLLPDPQAVEDERAVQDAFAHVAMMQRLRRKEYAPPPD